MAENKKSFVAYVDWIETFEELSDVEAGKLIKHIFKYVNDENPETDDKIVKLSFIPIKQALKRDLRKYEGYIEKQRVNGAKGGRPKKTQKTQAFIEKPKKADNVNDNVNDNVSVTKKDFAHAIDLYIHCKKLTTAKKYWDFLEPYEKELVLNHAGKVRKILEKENRVKYQPDFSNYLFEKMFNLPIDDFKDDKKKNKFTVNEDIQTDPNRMNFRKSQ